MSIEGVNDTLSETYHVRAILKSNITNAIDTNSEFGYLPIMLQQEVNGIIDQVIYRFDRQTNIEALYDKFKHALKSLTYKQKGHTISLTSQDFNLALNSFSETLESLSLLREQTVSSIPR